MREWLQFAFAIAVMISGIIVAWQKLKSGQTALTIWSERHEEKQDRRDAEMQALIMNAIKSIERLSEIGRENHERIVRLEQSIDQRNSK